MSAGDSRAGPGDSEAAARLARATLADLESVTDRLVGDIIVENPEYYEAQRVSESDLRDSCRANLRRVLQLLGQRVPEGEDPYDAARRTGERRARQRVALDLVLRSFRLGGRVVWSSALETAGKEPGFAPETLLEVGTSVWNVVDAVSLAVSNAYRDAELEMLRVDEQRRQVLVDGLLRGSGTDPESVESALRTLGLSVSGPYLVVAAEIPADVSEVPAPEQVLQRCGMSSVWQAQAGMLVGLVSTEHHRVEEVPGALRSVLPCGMGLSPTVCRGGSIPWARELAVLALRTLPPGDTGTAWLDDRLPRAVLVRCPELAERLVERALGPVLRLPATEREPLLDTLESWLDSDCSAKRTAARLYCHRNTVLNRLHRLEGLLGRPVSGVEETVWLRLALYALRMRTRW
ncbi:PucR family transcriptional regulator [Actinopolyspora mortivallis]|uniref:PucR family transcriptional regulator n=1 Tax=Actinopolyspora mortivallis TaxID=33906 RepID=A0A2T0GX58_ACTMO|nr:helix-turn-helix domain-containing protein [Actinopolyspora mortivallis]PRW63696.1 PucR family transcriptional regulator [Actinopolyspora mortivallis]